MWTEIGTINDIPKLGARVVKSAGGDIAVFRTADDEIFALYDRCPHKGGALSQGIVHGKAVACPMHNWNINLNTGEVMGPDAGCSRTIPVSVNGEMIRLQMPDVKATGTNG
jgi:nitrite reductase (NADH) small subunit